MNVLRNVVVSACLVLLVGCMTAAGLPAEELTGKGSLRTA